MAQNENAYDRFRRNAAVGKSCALKKTAYFIQHHESSTEIQVVRTAETLPAVVVMNHAEGADNALLYVYAEADLKSGDYFTWKDDYHFFAFERVTIIKDVEYKKFTALECNVLVNDNIWGYFLGSKRGLKNTNLQAGFYEVTNLQPVLIVPKTDEIKLNGYITINSQQWRVVSADLDSISNIGYYYLERALNDRDLEAEEEQLEDQGLAPTSKTIYIGQNVDIETEDGFAASSDIQIIKRSAGLVTFTPLKSGKITVQRKQLGEIQSVEYEVREI